MVRPAIAKPAIAEADERSPLDRAVAFLTWLVTTYMQGPALWAAQQLPQLKAGCNHAYPAVGVKGAPKTQCVHCKGHKYSLPADATACDWVPQSQAYVITLEDGTTETYPSVAAMYRNYIALGEPEAQGLKLIANPAFDATKAEGPDNVKMVPEVSLPDAAKAACESTETGGKSNHDSILRQTSFGPRSFALAVRALQSKRATARKAAATTLDAAASVAMLRRIAPAK